MYQNFIFALLLAIGFSGQVFADDVNATALQDTLNCLRTQTCESASTAEGMAADQRAAQAVNGNSANKQALYDISADIMPILMQQSGGDPNKMLAIMQNAQTNPEGFFNSLPPEIQAKIQSAASAAEKNQ